MDKDILDVDTLLDDFARLSIASSNIYNPARRARRRSPTWRILCAGLFTLVVTLAVCFCLQRPHQPLQVAPAMFSGSHLGAVSNDLAEVCSTPGDPLPAFSASLGSAEPALHRAAVLHSLPSAVQPASTIVSAVKTSAATSSAWESTETFPAAPAETNIMLASELAEARTVHGSEVTRLGPVQTAAAAVDIDTAAMQSAEMAAAGTDIGAGANTTMTPVSASTPGPQPENISFDLEMSVVNAIQVVVAHTLREAPDRKPADDIAAAALAFKPGSRWHVQDLSSAPDIAEAGSPELEDLLIQLPIRLKQQMTLSSASKPAAAFAAMAELIEASASVALTTLVAVEEFVCTWFCHITR